MTTTPTTACPTCGHSAAHSALAGCTYVDGATYCPCSERWSRPKTLAVAAAERDVAMTAVSLHTDPAWEAAAIDAIRTLADRPEPFTSDDVWDLLAERGAPECREPRALGTIVREAIRHDVIKPDGFVSSRRRHCTPIRSYVGGAL